MHYYDLQENDVSMFWGDEISGIAVFWLNFLELFLLFGLQTVVNPAEK